MDNKQIPTPRVDRFGEVVAFTKETFHRVIYNNRRGFAAHHCWVIYHKLYSAYTQMRDEAIKLERELATEFAAREEADHVCRVKISELIYLRDRAEKAEAALADLNITFGHMQARGVECDARIAELEALCRESMDCLESEVESEREAMWRKIGAALSRQSAKEVRS